MGLAWQGEVLPKMSVGLLRLAVILLKLDVKLVLSLVQSDLALPMAHHPL